MSLLRFVVRVFVLLSVAAPVPLFAQGILPSTIDGHTGDPAGHSASPGLTPGAGTPRLERRGWGSLESATFPLQFTFESASTCDLAVTVRDLDGSTRSGATVKRFGSAGLLDSRVTNDAGQALWSDIAAGTYRFDAYFQRPDPFDTVAMFWARATTTLTQAVQVVNLQRNQPAVGGFRVVRENDDSDVTGESVDVGTPVRLEVGVWNNSSSPGNTRVQVRLDRSRSSPWDFDQLADYVTIPGGGQYVAAFTPDQPGVYYAACRVDVTQEGKTDSRDWFVAFEAVSLDGRFEPSAYSLDFGSVEVGRTQTRGLTVSNLGNIPIELHSLVFQDSGFTLASPQTMTVAGHSTAEVTLVFAPSSVEAYSHFLSLYTSAAPLRVQHVDLSGSGKTAGQEPIADFTWDPQTPVAGETVHFELIPGRAQTVKWDFESDGTFDSDSTSPTHAFPGPGPYQVYVEVENPYGKDTTTKTVRVGGGTGPAITRVDRQYPGFFLQGADFTNQFGVGVDWKGSPGKVGFSINGGAPVWHDGDRQGASHLFDMDRDFSPGFSPTRVTMTPQNAAGVQGSPWTESMYVFPWPRWLEFATGGRGVDFQVGQGEVKTLIGLQFPRTPLAAGCDPAQGEYDCPIRIPDWVPLLGGEFGLTETYATLDGQISSSGKGNLRLWGQTGFAAMNRWVRGEASGAGNLLLSAGDGLELLDGKLELRLSGTMANNVGILELIPGLKSLAKKPVFKQFNKVVRFQGQVSPRLNLAAQFAQDAAGDLAFTEAEGELGLQMLGALQASLGLLSARVWLAGDGTIYLALPEPLLREMVVKLQAGARISINYLFGTWRKQVTANAGCRWTRGGGIHCGLGDEYLLASIGDLDGIPVYLIKIPYARYGAYSRFKPTSIPRQEGVATPVNTALTSLVQNLFPGASPCLTNVGNGSLLLWEHQDVADPVLQSTEIAFSWNGGGGWSAPLLINDDTRAELVPVAAQDGRGGAVAAWTRSSDPNFDQVPGTFEEMAPFFRQMEIVTARFDPAGQSWTQPAPLTQNTAFESDLQLAFDGNGRVWLTWLENGAGELISTAEAPSRLRYSIWDGSSWSNPVTVADGLVGVGSHSLAVSAAAAVILVPVDPDPDLDGDERIDLYSWQGSNWSAGTTFAGGDGAANRLPAVAYDASGIAHVVWVRNGDLVQATIQNPVPSLVREQSAGLGFFDARLLPSPEGHLALVFQRETEEGPGDVFALVYDALTDSWSADRRLTQQTTASAYDLSGYFDSTGKVHLAYLDDYLERTTETVVIEGQDWDIPGIPQEGRTDLELLERSLIVDLAVEQADLSLLPPEPEPGETVEVRVKVHNSGDFPVGSFQVAVLRGSRFGLMSSLASTTVSGIRAGDYEEVSLSFAYPNDPEIVTILSFVVDNAHQIPEFSENNNSISIPLPSLPPVADPVASVTRGLAPLTVDFDGSTSVDPDGSVVGYEWKIPNVVEPIPGVTTTFTFDQPGAYPVGLTVTDDRGRKSTSYVTITVQPARHFFPFYQADRRAFTGFAVSNFSAHEANLELRLYDAAGVLVVGPILTRVAAGAQLAQLGRELFSLPAGTAESGWVEIRSDNPEVGSFFLFGNGAGLDGALDSVRFSRRLCFTRVLEGSTAFRGRPASTFLSIANPTDSEVLLNLTLHHQLVGGSAAVAQASREIPAGGFLYESVAELFGDVTSVENGYVVLEVQEGEGVVGFALVKLNGGETTIGFAGTAGENGTSQSFSAQLASLPNRLYTNLRLINLSDEAREIDLIAVAEDGTPLAASVRETLGPGEALQADVADRFDFEGADPVVGSLRVEADGGGILGDVVFGSPDLRYAAAMPLQTSLASKAIFSQVANIPGSFFTGLALYNPQARKAEVRIDVFRDDGSPAGSQTIQLEPGHRLSKTLDELVPASAGVVRGYVRIESTEPVVLQQLFGDFIQSLLAAVPPTIVE